VLGRHLPERLCGLVPRVEVRIVEGAVKDVDRLRAARMIPELDEELVAIDLVVLVLGEVAELLEGGVVLELSHRLHHVADLRTMARVFVAREVVVAKDPRRLVRLRAEAPDAFEKPPARDEIRLDVQDFPEGRERLRPQAREELLDLLHRFRDPIERLRVVEVRELDLIEEIVELLRKLRIPALGELAEIPAAEPPGMSLDL